MNSESMEEHEERRRDLDVDANETDVVAEAPPTEGAVPPPARRNRASNLTEADRRRGGQSSARKQVRDEHGQFAGPSGRKGEGGDSKGDGQRARSRRTKSRS